MPAPRAAGQLLPEHPRGNRFGTILAQRPFVFTGGRRKQPSLDIRALTMSREADGHVCLQVRFAKAPRPDSRLLVRWFNPCPAATTWGARARSSCASTGAAGCTSGSTAAAATSPIRISPCASASASRRSGAAANVISIRLSAQDMSNPERFRIALQSASTTASDPARIPVVAAGDAMGAESAGFEWPSGQPAPLFDRGPGPAG